jgi:perosamine synthetase
LSETAHNTIRIEWPSRGHGYTEEEIAVVAEVMREQGTSLTQGVRVRQFEERFAAYVGVRRAYSLMSCAHSLDIAAMLLECGPGDEVIIPAHTYCATALAFARRGATLRWADIRPDSLTAAASSIRSLISDKTKVIVIVHLYGLLGPETEEIAIIARERGVTLVEDCAQSLGARLGKRHCGTFGDIGCYSFHAQKNLSTLGEGGMIVVADESLAAKVAGLRLNGHAPFVGQTEYWLPAMSNVVRDVTSAWPLKSTMTEAQAAVGTLVLARLDALVEERRRRSLAIREAMAEFPELEFQEIHSPEAHSHHLLPARCRSTKWTRDDLISLLSTEYGIKAVVQYYPLNRYEMFRDAGFGKADVPETDQFFDNMVSFPFSPDISDEDNQYLIESLGAAIKQLNA